MFSTVTFSMTSSIWLFPSGPQKEKHPTIADGWLRGSLRRFTFRVFGTIVRGKLFGTLRTEIPPHYIHGFAGGRARRTKDPSALRAARCLSVVFLDPYQFAG
jgi:hypothetical protein